MCETINNIENTVRVKNNETQMEYFTIDVTDYVKTNNFQKCCLGLN